MSANGLVDRVLADSPNGSVDKTDALCENYTIFCPDFFTAPNATYVGYNLLRMILSAFVLFLSSKIPKDFLKRFTLSLFIPLFIAQLARFATNILFYLKHFHMDSDVAVRIMTAEGIIDLIFRVTSNFVYYAFLSKSIVVYHGLFLAFLHPEKFEHWKSGFWFNLASVVPFIILIAMNIPWGRIQDIEVYIKYSCRIILGVVMIPFYLRTVFFLAWKKQQRDAIIDDRSIISKAKSRLVWFTVYMTVMNVINFFHFVESFFFIFFYASPMAAMNDVFFAAFNHIVLYASVADELRPLILVICTLFFIPVYREAILFCRKAPVVFKSAVLDLNDGEQPPRNTGWSFKH